GIRDFHVTGVQTCALPISSGPREAVPRSSTAPTGRRNVATGAASAASGTRGQGEPDSPPRRGGGTHGRRRDQPFHRRPNTLQPQIGRASCRERGEISVVGV